MSAACALNISTPLRRYLPFRLPGKNCVIHYVSLHGEVKNTAFPALQAFSMNGKQRFTMMCMPCHSYDVQQSSAAYGSTSAAGDDRSGLAEDVDLGPVLNFVEVTKEAEASGVSLPLDLLESAKSTGIPKLCLQRYLSMQGLGWGLGFVMRYCSMFRNQMMIDPKYPTEQASKLAFEVVMDVIIATVMKILGTESKDIAFYLGFWLIFKVVYRGLIVPYKYASRIEERQKSISEGLLADRMFVADRSWSLILASHCCSYVFCCATTTFTNSIIKPFFC